MNVQLEMSSWFVTGVFAFFLFAIPSFGLFWVTFLGFIYCFQVTTPGFFFFVFQMLYHLFSRSLLDNVIPLSRLQFFFPFLAQVVSLQDRHGN